MTNFLICPPYISANRGRLCQPCIAGRLISQGNIVGRAPGGACGCHPTTALAGRAVGQPTILHYDISLAATLLPYDMSLPAVAMTLRYWPTRAVGHLEAFAGVLVSLAPVHLLSQLCDLLCTHPQTPVSVQTPVFRARKPPFAARTEAPCKLVNCPEKEERKKGPRKKERKKKKKRRVTWALGHVMVVQHLTLAEALANLC
eukprot:276295-Rhodomonas_salina.1